MITSEKYIEKKLCEAIKELNGMCIKLTTEYGYIGLPDRLCILKPNIIFFVEVKSTGKKPRKIQLIMHEKLTNLGFKVFTIDRVSDIDTIKEFIKEKQWKKQNCTTIN